MYFMLKLIESSDLKQKITHFNKISLNMNLKEIYSDANEESSLYSNSSAGILDLNHRIIEMSTSKVNICVNYCGSKSLTTI